MPPRHKSRQKARVVRSARPQAPPMIRSNITFNHRFRFTATAAQTVVITSSDLLFVGGCTGIVLNNIVTSFYGSAKVNSVSVWAPPAAQGSFATTSIEYAGQAAGSNLEFSDTSVSTAQPAVLHTRPPAHSLASFWQTPAVANNNLFTLTVPAGSIIDLDLGLILFDDESAAQNRGVTAAALGTIYYLALDNATGHNLVPVSLTTTF